MTPLERQAIIRLGPWIFYDGTCNLCSGGAVRLGPIVQRRGFKLATLQGLIGREFPTGNDETIVLTREGKVLGGAEAYAYICRHVWWATPITLLWYLRFGRPLLNWIYRWVARNRFRMAGTCQLKSHPDENPYAVEL